MGVYEDVCYENAKDIELEQNTLHMICHQSNE